MIQQTASAHEIVRNIAIFTLVGFLVLTLSGPAIALAGALLPFALVGFAVWLVYKGVTVGPRVAFRTLGAVVAFFARAIIFLPALFLRKSWGAVRWVGRFFNSFMWEVLLGVSIGAILGGIGGIQQHDAEYRVPMGMALGAAIGLMAALVRDRPAAAKAELPAPAVVSPESPVVLSLHAK